MTGRDQARSNVPGESEMELPAWAVANLPKADLKLDSV
jgi:hypothetical protein